MAINNLKQQYIPRNNDFYRHHAHHFIIIIMVVIVLMLGALGMLVYEMANRPLPTFSAIQPNKSRMALTAFDEPNLTAPTIIRWASKAATAAYTFSFVNYATQIAATRPYFTEDGWNDYQASVKDLLSSISQNQLFVYGIVSGAPVISNQGPIGNAKYAWRVQIPFLVTYQSANTSTKRRFYVSITIVRVPTSQNPQGIGIDQFVMGST